MIPYQSFQKAVEQMQKNALRDIQYLAIIHPLIWNGYWYIRERSHFLRWLGRKLHSRRIYWLGLRVEWVTGLKDLVGE